MDLPTHHGRGRPRYRVGSVMNGTPDFSPLTIKLIWAFVIVMLVAVYADALLDAFA